MINPDIKTIRLSNKVQGSAGRYRGKISPPSTVTKAIRILPMSGDNEVVQYISSINKTGQQETFSIKKRKMRGQIYTQEIMRDIILPGSFYSGVKQ